MFLEFSHAFKKRSSGLQSDKRLGWKNAVLDLSSILFIKSELHRRRFAPLCNSEIIKENYNLLLRRKCSLKVRFKKFWVVKNIFSAD